MVAISGTTTSYQLCNLATEVWALMARYWLERLGLNSHSLTRLWLLFVHLLGHQYYSFVYIFTIQNFKIWYRLFHRIETQTRSWVLLTMSRTFYFQGQFGEVFRGLFKPSVLTVAVKTCRSTMDDEIKKKFLQEARILKQYNHPNIVKFIGIASQREPVMIVMEYVPGTSRAYWERCRYMFSEIICKFWILINR